MFTFLLIDLNKKILLIIFSRNVGNYLFTVYSIFNECKNLIYKLSKLLVYYYSKKSIYTIYEIKFKSICNTYLLKTIQYLSTIKYNFW